MILFLFLNSVTITPLCLKFSKGKAFTKVVMSIAAPLPAVTLKC